MSRNEINRFNSDEALALFDKLAKRDRPIKVLDYLGSSTKQRKQMIVWLITDLSITNRVSIYMCS